MADINELLYDKLGTLGFDGALPDRAYDHLASLGYTGALNDRLSLAGGLRTYVEGLLGAVQWMQTPPTLVNPLVVSDYDLYGIGDATRVINGGDGDVLLLAHSPAGGPAQTLFNTKISVYNFRRLHVYGLDLEVTDPLLTTRVLQIKTSSDRTTTEEVFIEGLSMEHNFIAGDCDGIVVLNLGIDAGPVSRFVLQSSRITGVGVPTNADGPGVHPDIMQMQGNTRIDNVYIENFTGTTMYQGLFLPWNQNTTSSAFAPEYALRNVNISSEDSFTHRLFTTQDEGYTAAEYPITSFDNVYLSQGQTHSFGVGPSEIHVDPLLYDDSPFEFVAAARITGLPTTGRASSDFASRARVGINYVSPHGLPIY